MLSIFQGLLADLALDLTWQPCYPGCVSLWLSCPMAGVLELLGTPGQRVHLFSPGYRHQPAKGWASLESGVHPCPGRHIDGPLTDRSRWAEGRMRVRELAEALPCLGEAAHGLLEV